ncbi:MAG: hemolysin family protein [Anditalea sp.]
MTLLIVYFSLAIAVSFLCSLLEAALLSVTPSYIVSEEEKGKTYATQLKGLKTNIDKPLASILSYNTIAHTVGAAGVGAQAVAVFGEEYFGVISAVLTIAILVFSEIIPKSMGARYWRQIAPFMGGVLKIMIYSLYPLVKFSEFITRAFSKGGKQTTSREEVAALTSLAAKEGVFEENESKIIHNLIRFKSIRVGSVMTPRTVVFAIEENKSLKELFDIKRARRFSRIPVYKDSIDNIRGYVLKYDILDKLASDEFDHTIKELTREMTVIFEHYSIPSVLELLMSKREHIALVVDEYGGMAGIVTLEDILETLLGLEIQDESDSEVDMQQLARNQWTARAKKLGLIFSQDGENID